MKMKTEPGNTATTLMRREQLRAVLGTNSNPFLPHLLCSGSESCVCEMQNSSLALLSLSRVLEKDVIVKLDLYKSWKSDFSYLTFDLLPWMFILSWNEFLRPSGVLMRPFGNGL